MFLSLLNNRASREEETSRRTHAKRIMNLLVLFSVLLGAVAANAQDALCGKFHLANQVRWGQSMLPAGDYSFVLKSEKRPLIIGIYSADGRAVAFAMARATESASEGSYILITQTGSNRVVRSINLPQLGHAFIYEPLNERKGEVLHAAHLQTLPVQIARK
jgi:hypothetical protein